MDKLIKNLNDNLKYFEINSSHELIPYFKRYVSDGLLITNLIQKSYDQIKIYIEENKHSIFLLYILYFIY